MLKSQNDISLADAIRDLADAIRMHAVALAGDEAEPMEQGEYYMDGKRIQK